MSNEWLTMLILTKENIFLSPNLHQASFLLLKEPKLTHMIETKGAAMEVF